DSYVMNDREKETIRKALGEKPKERLANAEWMLKAAGALRDIANGTRAEVYQIGAESAVSYLTKIGLDLAVGVTENVMEIATTACLFFGYADAATTISVSCGGGESNNELPKKKDDEDELAFARRCHQAAKTECAKPRYRWKR
ncbi:MAG: hypothetical protein II886_08370, partial [Prevotella sp.]|nr:hypothetical protein [Prevotella sp.]